MTINDYSDGLVLTGALFLSVALVAAIVAGMLFERQPVRRAAVISSTTATIGFIALLAACWLAVIGR